MSERHYGLYEAIVDATNSEVILFFIIVAMVMAVVVAPLYIAILKDRKAARQHDAERDKARQQHETESKQQIIDILKANIEAVTSLKSALENNGFLTNKALDRIHVRLDRNEAEQKTIASEVAQINIKFDNTLRNQTEMASKINKILVISSGGKLSSDGREG